MRRFSKEYLSLSHVYSEPEQTKTQLKVFILYLMYLHFYHTVNKCMPIKNYSVLTHSLYTSHKTQKSILVVS